MSRRYPAQDELRQPADGLGHELRSKALMRPVKAVLEAADRPLRIDDVRARIPGARHHDVKTALYMLRSAGLAHGRVTWKIGSSPTAKRPVVIRKLGDTERAG